MWLTPVKFSIRSTTYDHCRSSKPLMSMYWVGDFLSGRSSLVRMSKSAFWSLLFLTYANDPPRFFLYPCRIYVKLWLGIQNPIDFTVLHDYLMKPPNWTETKDHMQIKQERTPLRYNFGEANIMSANTERHLRVITSSMKTSLKLSGPVPLPEPCLDLSTALVFCPWQISINCTLLTFIRGITKVNLRYFYI